MTPEEKKILLKAQKGEMDGVLMYRSLAGAVKKRKDAETFQLLAAEEGRHAAVFRKLTGQSVRPNPVNGMLLAGLYHILGRKRLYPLIAKGEYGAVKTYEPLCARFPETESVKADEKRHGDTVMKLLE